jgi:ComEC/Rec2-related protein
MTACCYVAGLLAGNRLEPPVPWLFAACGLAASAAFGFARLRPALLWLLVFLTGWTGIRLRTAILSPHDLRSLVATEAELVTLRGRLPDTPSWRLYQHHALRSTNTQAEVEVELLKQGDLWQPAFGRVAVSTGGPLGPGFFAGRTVEVTGVLRPPPSAAADGLFDYRNYLARRGIYFQLHADSTNDWRIADAPGESPAPPLADRFRAWGQRTLARGLPGPDEALRLNWAMVLGWTTALTSEVSAPFMRSGTMHIFAISGLHIALIAGILVSLLRVLQVPRGACGLGVIPAIWFYTAATGWQASAIRSTIMMSVIIVGWMLHRPVDVLNSLAAAAFIILVWDPQQLFQASFQLSFCAVLSIALLLPPIERWRQRLFRHDPLLPDELRPRWRRWLDPPIHFLTTSLATSLAAWLGSVPIVACYFHLFTPVSLLANLIVIPLSSLALMSGLGSLLCGDWLPALTELFNYSGWFWMKCMVAVSEGCAALPGAYCYVSAPGWVGFPVYYALVFALLTGWAFQAGRLKWVCAGAAAVALTWTFHAWAHRTDVTITVLPLRGGDAIYVDAPGSADDLLIDCGDESAAQRVVVPFLRARGLNRLATLVLTHGDLRHVAGAPTVVGEFKVRRLVTSEVRFRSKAYRNAIESVTGVASSPDGRVPRVLIPKPAIGNPQSTVEGGRPIQRHPASRGTRLGSWRALHPDPSDRFALADDHALVLLGEFHGTRILLCSDLGRLGQCVLAEREKDLRADVVIAGMPNSGEPLSDALLDAVQPQAIILSTGESPASERPTLALRGRLNRRHVSVFLTGDDGAVRVMIRPEGWEIRTRSGKALPPCFRYLDTPEKPGGFLPPAG